MPTKYALYRRKWRKANPEKEKANRARFKKKHGQKYFRDAHRKHFLKNKAKINARNRAYWKKLDPKERYFRSIFKRFGMTRQDYAEMFRKQDGRCSICRCTEKQALARLRGMQQKRQVGLCVDHDHETGLPRALLCPPCNTAVGMVYENTWIAKRLIEYIRRVAPRYRLRKVI